MHACMTTCFTYHAYMHLIHNIHTCISPYNIWHASAQTYLLIWIKDTNTHIYYIPIPCTRAAPSTPSTCGGCPGLPRGARRETGTRTGQAVQRKAEPGALDPEAPTRTVEDEGCRAACPLRCSTHLGSGSVASHHITAAAPASSIMLPL